MLNLALFASLFAAASAAVVPLRVPVDIDLENGGSRTWGSPSPSGSPPLQATCEPGEIEIGEVNNGDGDCSIVSYAGVTEDCHIYTRAELVCLDVIYEDIES